MNLVRVGGQCGCSGKREDERSQELSGRTPHSGRESPGRAPKPSPQPLTAPSCQ